LFSIPSSAVSTSNRLNRLSYNDMIRAQIRIYIRMHANYMDTNGIGIVQLAVLCVYTCMHACMCLSVCHWPGNQKVSGLIPS